MLPARPERDSPVERPPQTGRPACDSHDDIRACHSAGTAAPPEPAGGQPLYGTARRKHSRRHPRRTDGPVPLHARLQSRSGGNVQRPAGSRRCRQSHKRPACRTRRRAYHREREKQSGRAAGYAGMRARRRSDRLCREKGEKRQKDKRDTKDKATKRKGCTMISLITLQPFQHPVTRILSLHQSRDTAWSTPWIPLPRFRSGRD